MKRLVALLGAFGVTWFAAFSATPVAAQQSSYPPGPNPELEAVPDEVTQGGSFDAVVTGCFPGETVTFYNYDPFQTDQAVCDDNTYTASVTFQAPSELGTHYISAYIPALVSDDPDIPDLDVRFLLAQYTVVPDVILANTELSGRSDGGVTFSATAGRGVPWPSFLTSVGFYRSFLALLALMLGIFFVVLWRRRREEEEEETRGYAGGPMPPPDPTAPTLA